MCHVSFLFFNKITITTQVFFSYQRRVYWVHFYVARYINFIIKFSKLVHLNSIGTISVNEFTYGKEVDFLALIAHVQT